MLSDQTFHENHQSIKGRDKLLKNVVVKGMHICFNKENADIFVDQIELNGEQC